MSAYGTASDPDSEDSQDEEAPNLVPVYVLDPVTGVEVRKMVPAGGSRYCDRRQSFSTPSVSAPRNHQRDSVTPESNTRHGRRTPQQGGAVGRPVERYPAFVAPNDEKEGKESSSKLPVLVQVARNCPVTWSRKVTTDKMNLALFCWATLSELLATRTGLAPSLL